MPDFFGRRNYLILFALITFSMVILTAHAREGSNGPIHSAQRIVMSATAPIQSAVTSIVSPIKDGWDYLIHFGQLTRENRELHKRISELKSEVTELKGLKSENSRLRKLVDLKEAKGFRSTTARVIGMPSSNWWSSVVVDRGLKDGIKPGMPVAARGSLVGQVTEVSQNSAKIILINDADSGVSVQVKRTGEVGVIKGQPKSIKLTLNYISRDSTIKKGDLVYSSGLGGVFPKDIYVGRVTSVRKTSYELNKIVEVMPPVDFTKLREVMIIKSGKGFEIKGVK